MVREAPQHCSRQLRPADPSRARTGLEELRTHGPWVRLHPLQLQAQAESSPPTCLQNSVPPGSPSRVQAKPSEWSFNRKGTGKHCCGKIRHLVSPRSSTPLNTLAKPQ